MKSNKNTLDLQVLDAENDSHKGFPTIDDSNFDGIPEEEVHKPD